KGPASFARSDGDSDLRPHVSDPAGAACARNDARDRWRRRRIVEGFFVVAGFSEVQRRAGFSEVVQTALRTQVTFERISHPVFFGFVRGRRIRLFGNNG